MSKAIIQSKSEKKPLISKLTPRPHLSGPNGSANYAGQPSLNFSINVNPFKKLAGQSFHILGHTAH